MAKPKQYAILNENGVRVSNDPGEATLVNGGGGKGIKADPLSGSDWKSWAGMAGGGALAYWLAKKMVGDDDEKDENGKKKPKGFLKSILPWLAAAAGGVGGHALGASMSQGGEGKGKKGDLAVEMSEDGKMSVKDPKDMATGGAAAVTGAALLGGSGLHAARAITNYLETTPQRNYNQANAILVDSARRNGGTPTTVAAREAGSLIDRAERIRAERAARMSGWRAPFEAARQIAGRDFGRPGTWRGMLGHNITTPDGIVYRAPAGTSTFRPGSWGNFASGWKGNAAMAAADAALGGGALWLALHQSAARERNQKALAYLKDHGTVLEGK